MAILEENEPLVADAEILYGHLDGLQVDELVICDHDKPVRLLLEDFACLKVVKESLKAFEHGVPLVVAAQDTD